jgi:hypothetical protein
MRISLGSHQELQGQLVAITCAMAASVSSRTDGTSFHPFEPSATRHAPSGTSIGRSAAVRPDAKEPRALPIRPLPPQNQRPPPLPLHHHSADSPARGHSEALKGGHQRHSEVIRDTQRHSSEALKRRVERGDERMAMRDVIRGHQR